MWNFEDAIYNATSCDQWSAYKLYRKNYIHKVVPVLRQNDEWIRNPEVITDRWLDESGEIVYGEWKSDEERKKGKEQAKALPRDLSLLDKAVEELAWLYANRFPMSTSMALSLVRDWKRWWYSMRWQSVGHWWNAAVYGEYDMGMTSFHTRKKTGKDTPDFIKYRQMLAKGHPIDEELYEEVMPKPKEEGK